MPFPIPTLNDLRAQILADFQARNVAVSPTAGPFLRRSPTKILAYVFAGAIWPVYRLIVWLGKQCFIATAETSYLELRLADFGIVREGPSAAAGSVTLSGIAGIPIPVNTGLALPDRSVLISTQAAGTIASGGTLTVAAEALTTGAAGNLPAGTILQVTTAIAGVSPAATVAPDTNGNGLTGGVDAESDAALLARGQQRLRTPPQGGAGTDYVAWAKTVPGVTRVWVYPLARGAGTVDVLFVMDGRTSNIPLSADITAVTAAVEALRPVAASNNRYAAPVADALTITVTNLVPNTPAVQAAVTAALNALKANVPAGGATIGDGVSVAVPGGTLQLQAIYNAISGAGATGFDLTAPSSDVTFASGHVPGTWTINLPALP